jgi:hypothetical protein
MEPRTTRTTQKAAGSETTTDFSDAHGSISVSIRGDPRHPWRFETIEPQIAQRAQMAAPRPTARPRLVH